MGITKPLAALASIPSERKTEKIKGFMRRAAQTMLSMDVFMYRLRNRERIAKKSWKRFCFPHLWTSDALDAMVVLTKAGAGEEKGTERARERGKKRGRRERGSSSPQKKEEENGFLKAHQKVGIGKKWESRLSG
jgi:hypothetical protein